MTIPPTRRRLLSEPAPIWPEARRLCPGRRFPPYRYVAGLNPHPVSHPDGHSYGAAILDEAGPRLAPSRWRESDGYLYGIDLYHQSYFWEAHEVWEGLWQQTDKGGAEGKFLQGLILNAAAQIKVHARNVRGAHNLSRRAWRCLRYVLDSGECDRESRFMGIRVPDLLSDIEAHYGPLWDGASGAQWVSGRPPRLSPC